MNALGKSADTTTTKTTTTVVDKSNTMSPSASGENNLSSTNANNLQHSGNEKDQSMRNTSSSAVDSHHQKGSDFPKKEDIRQQPAADSSKPGMSKAEIHQKVEELPASRHLNTTTDGDFLSNAGTYTTSTTTTSVPSTTSSSNNESFTHKLEDSYSSAKGKLFGALDSAKNSLHLGANKDTHVASGDDLSRGNISKENVSSSINDDSNRSTQRAVNDVQADTSRQEVDQSRNLNSNNLSTNYGSLDNSKTDFSTTDSAKQTIQHDYDSAKNKISESFDSAKEKFNDLTSGLRGSSYERDSSLETGSYSKADSAYVTSATSGADPILINNANAIEAGARLGNATEQMSEL